MLTLAGAAINYADEVAPSRRPSHEEQGYVNRGAAMKAPGLTYPFYSKIRRYVFNWRWDP